MRVGDRIRWTLSRLEVDLLRDLTRSLRALLDEGDGADPATARLFPRAVTGDDEADAELRGLIHEDLAGVKLAGVTAVAELLESSSRKGRERRVDLGPDDALLVLGVLNDVRLAIGARVGIERLDRGEVDPDGEDGYRLAVMDHLGMWQELLLAELDPPPVRRDGGLDPDDLL